MWYGCKGLHHRAEIRRGSPISPPLRFDPPVPDDTGVNGKNGQAQREDDEEDIVLGARSVVLGDTYVHGFEAWGSRLSGRARSNN